MKSMLNKSFNPSKCKTTLKLAVSRIKLMKNKKGIQLTPLKREVAQLLSSGQDQTAMIRVEHVVREEKTIAAFDLIEIYCELVVARLPIIESQKICPMDLKEAVTGIIFAAPRCADIPELKDISKQLTAKYGKDFVNAAVELRPDCGVNRTLVEKLSAQAPDGCTKIKILTTIAEENNIKWERKEPEPSFRSPEQGISSNFQATVNLEPRKGTTSSSSDGAAARSDSIQGIPSNLNHSAMPGLNSSNFGPSTKHSYSSVASGDESNSVRSNQYADKVSDVSHERRPNYNMGFKNATEAANAAARSAEEASIAAKAAAELASQSRKLSSAYSDSSTDYGHVHKKEEDMYNNGAFRDEEMVNNKTSSLPERNPGVKEYVPRDSSKRDKMFATASEVGPEGDQHRSVQPSAHRLYEQGNLPEQAEWEENARASKLSPKKDFHQEDYQIDTEIDSPYVLPNRDSTQTRTQPGSDDLSIASSHLVSQREHFSVDNPFFQERVEIKSSSPSYQYGDTSEDYSALDNTIPMFDDDPHEFPYDLHEKDALKEDSGLGKPYYDINPVPLSVYNQKENVFAHPEQKKYGFEPSDDGSFGIETKHMHPDISVNNAVFDDYGYEDDVSMSDLAGKEEEQRSATRNLSSPEKSPVVSSPESEKPPRNWERQSSTSSKHLYQPELTESFKNSPLFSQLDKPLRISFDDSDNDEDTTNSDGGMELGSVSAHHDSPKAKIRSYSGALGEVPESSLLQRGTSGLHPEPLVAKHLFVEKEQLGIGNLSSDNFSASDINTQEQSIQATLRSNSESLDNQNISVGENNEEEDQVYKESMKFTTGKESPDWTNKQSDIEISTELNAKSRPRARRNGGLLQPPYTKDPSNLSSTSATSRQSLDVTPKVSQWLATTPSSEWEELPHSSVGTFQKAGSDPDHKGDFDSFEGLGSQDEDIAALPGKGARVGAGVSRRTRASGESIPSSQPDSEPAYTAQSSPKGSIPDRTPSSASSNRSMERAQLLRWAEEQAGYNLTHQPPNSVEEETLGPSVEKQEMRSVGGRQMGNQRQSRDFPRRSEAEHILSNEPYMTVGEENLKPLVEKKQPPVEDRSLGSRRPRSELPRRKSTHKSETSLQEENLRPVVKEKRQADSTGESVQSGSHSTEDAPASTNSSMKRAGHVHPKLPDFDTLADRIRALNRDQQN